MLYWSIAMYPRVFISIPQLREKLRIEDLQSTNTFVWFGQALEFSLVVVNDIKYRRPGKGYSPKFCVPGSDLRKTSLKIKKNCCGLVI